MEGHREQAMNNHSQTLERLAERGGLSPKELWCVVHDKRYFTEGREMTELKAIEWLRSLGELVSWKVPG